MAATGLVSVDSDALESFKHELTNAQNSAGQAKNSAEGEVNKTLKSLEERIRHWERVRAQCQAALRSAENPRQIREAQQCINEANSKITMLKGHVNRVNKDAEKFRKSTRNFVQCLYEPIGILGGLLAVLERYWGMSARSNAISSSSKAVTLGNTKGANKVDYGTLDEYGRPTGIHTTITKSVLDTGTKANHHIVPPGYQANAGLARGHLYAKQLGGSGDDPRNLVTLYQNPTNHPWMSDIEAGVRNAVESGETIDYQVVPIYEKGEAIPKAISISAVGDKGFFRAISIFNRGSY